jgi:hypothetical protein
MGLLASVLLISPIRTLIDHVSSPYSDVLKFYSRKKTVITFSILVFSLTSISLMAGRSFPFSDILNLPFQASTNFFRQLRYLDTPLTELGLTMFEFGRYLFHGFVIYTVLDSVQSLLEKLKPEKSESEFRASLTPLSSSEAEIEIYVVSGLQGFLRIPESFCKECSMFYHAARQASEEVDEDVNISVRSYWSWFLKPLLKGGYHPPVILVNGSILSQGYDVPDKEDIKDFLED